MENLYIEGQVHLPNVILDKENNKLEISGQSMPEDVIAFYNPVLKWIDEYSKDPNDTTTFNMKLVYFNTSSSKMIYEMINKLDQLHKKNHNVKVHWYYDEEDEEMIASGKKLEKYFSIPFDFIGYNPE